MVVYHTFWGQSNLNTNFDASQMPKITNRTLIGPLPPVELSGLTFRFERLLHTAHSKFGISEGPAQGSLLTGTPFGFSGRLDDANPVSVIPLHGSILHSEAEKSRLVNR